MFFKLTEKRRKIQKKKHTIKSFNKDNNIEAYYMLSFTTSEKK